MKQPLYPNHEKFTAGAHIPFWVDSTEPLSYNKLTLDKEADVVVVGGGIAGVSVAYNLSKGGKKVMLVEDGYIGSGETGRTTAHLVTALDDRYYSLERIFGEEKTKRIAESHANAIDFIEHTVRKEQIDCDFQRLDGYLFLHPNDKPENLVKEYEASKKAGLPVEKVMLIPGMRNAEGAIRFSGQAQFHPLRYIKALCEAIVYNGGEIFTNTHASVIDHTGIQSDEGYRINAKHVVVATNTPVNNTYAMHLKQYPYRTYVIAAKVKKDSLPKALWWDTGDPGTNDSIPPYHYVRTQPYNDEYDLLIAGGEDHPTGLAETEYRSEEERYAYLESWTREHFTDVGETVYRWSGQVLEPMDSIAYIGRNPFDKNNVYIATGDSGNGMTHGTIAGMLIPDLIDGKENPLSEIYDPSRFKLFSAGDVFFKELAGGLIKYLRNKPDHPEDTLLAGMQPEEARIIEIDGKQYGAYKDPEDNIHFVSAKCTHLGCTIKWNNDEKSWDCACHGSRFTHEGKVLNGPANKDLMYYMEKTGPGKHVA